MYFVFQEEERS